MTDTASGLVELWYHGSPYYTRDVRYWLRSRHDGFVYESSDNADELTPNEQIGIWDRTKQRYLDERAGEDA